MSSFESLGNFYECALVCVSLILSFNDWKSHSRCLGLNTYWKNTYIRYLENISNTEIIKTNLRLHFTHHIWQNDVLESILSKNLCSTVIVDCYSAIVLPHLLKFKNLTSFSSSESYIIEQNNDNYRALFSRMKSLTVGANFFFANAPIFSSCYNLSKLTIGHISIQTQDQVDSLLTLLHNLSKHSILQSLTLDCVDFERVWNSNQNEELFYSTLNEFAPTLTNLEMRDCENFPVLVDYSKFAEHNLLQSVSYPVVSNSIYDSMQLSEVTNLFVLHACLTYLDLTGHVWNKDEQTVLQDICMSLPLLVTLKCALPDLNYVNEESRLVQDLQNLKCLKYLHLMSLEFIKPSSKAFCQSIETFLKKLNSLNLSLFEFNWFLGEIQQGVEPTRITTF